MEAAGALLLSAGNMRVSSATTVVNQLMFIISDCDNLNQEGSAVVQQWYRAAKDKVYIDKPIMGSNKGFHYF